jgi:hypothetical protein
MAIGSAIGGVIRTTPGSIRQLDRGFYGIGLSQPSIECLVAQVQLLLMHYGCNTSTSINGMIIEMDVSDQPFQESYAKYSSRVTNCWVKRLWEKLDRYGITVVLNNCPIKLPHEQDKWLMRELERCSFSLKKLELINKARLAQQVLFILDILGASGKALDRRYLQPRESHDTWSNLLFPWEQLSCKSYSSWRQALHQLAPAGGIVDRLGLFLHDNYKVWEWRHNVEGVKLRHIYGDRMDMYGLSENGRSWTLEQEEA